MTAPRDAHVVPQVRIERAILIVRGEKVIVDAELAGLYGVPTKRLNEQVKRNASRFPEDFMFQLTAEEYRDLLSLSASATAAEPNRSQIATGSQKHRDPRFLPNFFTEHGAIMAANVLNSDRAVEMSVHIVRTFVRLRQAATEIAELDRRLRAAERRIGQHDEHLAGIVRKLRDLTESPKPGKVRRIGFHTPEDEERK